MGRGRGSRRRAAGDRGGHKDGGAGGSSSPPPVVTDDTAGPAAPFGVFANKVLVPIPGLSKSQARHLQQLVRATEARDWPKCFNLMQSTVRVVRGGPRWAAPCSRVPRCAVLGLLRRRPAPA